MWTIIPRSAHPHAGGVRTFLPTGSNCSSSNNNKKWLEFYSTGATRHSLSQPLELHIDYAIFFVFYLTLLGAFFCRQPGGSTLVAKVSLINKKKGSQTSKRCCAAWGGDRVDGIFIRTHKKPPFPFILQILPTFFTHCGRERVCVMVKHIPHIFSNQAPHNVLSYPDIALAERTGSKTVPCNLFFCSMFPRLCKTVWSWLVVWYGGIFFPPFLYQFQYTLSFALSLCRLYKRKISRVEKRSQ